MFEMSRMVMALLHDADQQRADDDVAHVPLPAGQGRCRRSRTTRITS